MSKKKQPAPTPSPKVTVDRLCGWTAAAIFQGERLLEHLDRQIRDYPPWGTKWTQEQIEKDRKENALAGGHLVEEFESFWFACAVAQVLRWTPIAKEACAALGAPLTAFEAATPGAIDVRDMLVHEDEYLAGAGRNPERYRVRYEGSPLEGSAHSIAAVGIDGYVIGGRIDLRPTVERLKTLLPLIEAEARKPLSDQPEPSSSGE